MWMEVVQALSVSPGALSFPGWLPDAAGTSWPPESHPEDTDKSRVGLPGSQVQGKCYIPDQDLSWHLAIAFVPTSPG